MEPPRFAVKVGFRRQQGQPAPHNEAALAPVTQLESEAFCPSITKHSQSLGSPLTTSPPLLLLLPEAPLATIVVAVPMVVTVVVDVDGPLVGLAVVVVVQSEKIPQSSIEGGVVYSASQLLSSTLGHARETEHVRIQSTFLLLIFQLPHGPSHSPQSEVYQLNSGMSGGGGPGAGVGAGVGVGASVD